MTKDEDDWLSDFLELAQGSARQSQMAAEKEYNIRLKLLTPRIERARVCDADEALAKIVAASEALAGQGKFDAAADQLDAAFALAGRLLETAAAAAAAERTSAVSESLESAGVPVEPPAQKEPENLAAGLDAMLADVPSGEAAAAETPTEENPLGDLDAMLADLPSGEAPVSEATIEIPAPDSDTAPSKKKERP